MTRAVEQRSQMLSRVLGEELRTLRKRRGWTRRDLLKRLDLGISLQTLATYELGTRKCSVTRLWELSEALEEPMEQLVVRVMQRVGEREISVLIIDLTSAAKTTVAKLEPLRAWAKIRLSTLPDGHAPVAQLDRAALGLLAEVCGIDIADLVHRLRDRRAGLTCPGR